MSRFTDRIDMRFQYTTAAATDIGKTIRRKQRELAAEKERQEAAAAALDTEKAAKVRQIKK